MGTGTSISGYFDPEGIPQTVRCMQPTGGPSEEDPFYRPWLGTLIIRPHLDPCRAAGNKDPITTQCKEL